MKDINQNYLRYSFFALTYALSNLYYMEVYKCIAPIRYIRYGVTDTYLIYR